jgi:hypothetical protein
VPPKLIARAHEVIKIGASSSPLPAAWALAVRATDLQL